MGHNCIPETHPVPTIHKMHICSCLYVWANFLKKINPLLIIFNIIYCQGLKMHIILIVLQVQKEPLVSASCWLISGSKPVNMISESY